MDLLRHTGIVKEVTSTSLIVSIVNQSACSTCHAKGACSVSDIQEKEIEVTNWKRTYQPGAMVTVLFRESSGMRALLLGYMLPFVLLILTLVITVTVTGNEILSGLLALLVLVPYYLTLYLLKDKIKQSFTFELEET
jgi:sigma-E factor negative regulatory protein RseC